MRCGSIDNGVRRGMGEKKGGEGGKEKGCLDETSKFTTSTVTF
jgi:hypothetical protein